MNNADKIKIQLYKYLSKNLTDQHIAVPEVSIANNVADMLVSNGHIHIFEIKSKTDTLKRLPKQISTFSKYSNFVTIVAHEKFIQKIIDDPELNQIGIISINDNNTLTDIRNATFKPMPASHYLAYFNTAELREVLRGMPKWYKFNFIDAENKLLELLTFDEIRRLTLFRIKEKYSQEFKIRQQYIKEKKYTEALHSRFQQDVCTQVTPLTEIPYKVFKDFNY